MTIDGTEWWVGACSVDTILLFYIPLCILEWCAVVERCPGICYWYGGGCLLFLPVVHWWHCCIHSFYCCILHLPFLLSLLMRGHCLLWPIVHCDTMIRYYCMFILHWTILISIQVLMPLFYPILFVVDSAVGAIAPFDEYYYHSVRCGILRLPIWPFVNYSVTCCYPLFFLVLLTVDAITIVGDADYRYDCIWCCSCVSLLRNYPIIVWLLIHWWYIDITLHYIHWWWCLWCCVTFWVTALPSVYSFVFYYIC